MQKKIRIFVAVELPVEVKREVARIQSVLSEAQLFEGGYVQPDIAHVTMKFIGDVDESDIVQIDHTLKKVGFISF